MVPILCQELEKVLDGQGQNKEHEEGKEGKEKGEGCQWLENQQSQLMSLISKELQLDENSSIADFELSLYVNIGDV